MRKIFTVTWQASFIVVLSAVLLEVALRFYPSAIPTNFLVRFTPNIRSNIATGRNLPTKKILRKVPRDDGGPNLLVPIPGITINMGFVDLGAVNPQHTDDFGFCNDQPSAFHADKVDIIAMGDSFTWCTAVAPADTWVAELGKISSLSTYNMGVPGIGLYEHLQILKWFGLQKNDLPPLTGPRCPVSLTKHLDPVKGGRSGLYSGGLSLAVKSDTLDKLAY
jgi:hypothetical protein